MQPNVAGRIIDQVWTSLPARFAFVSLDAFVVMPNHVHAIILLTDGDGHEQMTGQLGLIIRTFKAASTKMIRDAGIDGFAWQRNYYDHVVRNEAELTQIREYIDANPSRWMEDVENPDGVRPERREDWER